jgi:hypothetical protein
MRIRIGIIMAYLLLGCLLLEDALPYFAKTNMMEMYESNAENGEKDTQKEKEIEDEWSQVKDRHLELGIRNYSFLNHPGSILADSEVIPDSAHLSVYTPPPDLA